MLAHARRRLEDLRQLGVVPEVRGRAPGHQQRGQVLGQLRVVADAVGERVAHPVQLVQQHGRVRGPQARLARGRPGDQRVDVRRQVGNQRRRRRDVVVHVLVGDLDRCLALVRLGPGEELEEHHAGGVDVGAGIGLALDDQLRSQVGDAADQHALGGVLGLGADGLGQPEVGDLDPAVVGDQHVLRLDVAVDQPRPVGRAEGREHRLHQRQRPLRRHRALLDDGVPQGVAGDQLHHDEQGAVDGLVLALVVDRHDVGVRQSGGRPRLAHEPGSEGFIVAEAGVHDLDRHRAVEPEVGAFVDAGHAPSGDPGADPVAAVEHPADHGVARRRTCTRAGTRVVLHSDPPAPDGEGSGASIVRSPPG